MLRIETVYAGMKIKNRERLLSTGDIAARKVLLEIIEKSLQALDSYKVVGGLLSLKGNSLRVGDFQWDLEQKHRLFVIGAGKACNSMAKAVEERLGDRVNRGLVIVKRLEAGDELERIELVPGGHPLPNTDGLRASQRILDIVEQATPDDLFICLISGGSSALMSCPVPGITLEDEIAVTQELLNSGARITEINAVRRHISTTNGGRLAQKIEAKGAEMINLIISDGVGARPTVEPGQPVEFFGTPVAPDSTTIQDALDVLKRYDLRSWVPHSIVEFLETKEPTRETPKVLGDQIHHFVIQRPADACEAAKRAADELGYGAMILTTVLQGDSCQAGTFLACVAKEVALNQRPISPPCLLIAGGETTTKVDTTSGLGGPSQELALGFALEIDNLRGFSIVSIDTDGTDGPTEFAGGVVDCTTVERARLKGLNLYERLMSHDSSTVFRVLGDEVITGNTGTNVCDLNVIYVA